MAPTACGRGAPRRGGLRARRGRLEREQYFDFGQLRGLRKSLLCRCESTTDFRLAPERIASMGIAASPALLRAAADGKPLIASGQPDAATGAEAQALRALFEW